MAKWILKHGIHKGTSATRETLPTKEFNTEKEAMKYYRKYRRTWQGIGYQIWYARLRSPDGVEEVLESNPYN